MVRKTARALFALLSCGYFLFISLFGLCDYLYPDSISKFVGESVESSLCFSYVSDPEEEAVEAFAGISSVQTGSGQILAFGILPLKSIHVNFYPASTLIPGGSLFGVKLSTRGLIVSGVGNVQTEAGSVSPGSLAGMKKGDIILNAGGVEIESVSDFTKIISKSAGSALKLVILRDEKEQTLSLTAVNAADGSGYKAGLWVRDHAAGIGTVTYINPVTGQFGGLGHAVCESETGMIFPFKKGIVTAAVLEGITKGTNGSPGEIRGSLGKSSLGSLLGNTRTGVFGIFEHIPEGEGEAIPIALKNEVETGKAKMICTLDGFGKKEYEIEIEEIIASDAETKNFIIRVTDEALLEQTGGIIQGMSGSPIVQNGKLVGAVTHVLVNNSGKGYGIFIENMLKNEPAV